MLEKLDKKFLFIVCILAFVVRLYRIDYPLLDWHSWRQADTASVTREYVKNGINLLQPTFHDLSNIPSSLDNSEHGYRMVEFPFVNALVATILILIPSFDLVVVSRVISILFSMLTLVSLYHLADRIWSKEIARWSALVFAFLPFSIYYSRVILPEPIAVGLLSFSIWQFAIWAEEKKDFSFWVSAVSLSLAMLLKPFVAFFGPVYLVLLYWHFKQQKKSHKHLLTLATKLVGFFVIVFGPLAWWRTWISQFPEGIPANEWLFNGNGIRFRPAWFRWLGYERLTKLILGYVGVVFAVSSLASLFKKKKKLKFNHHVSSYLLISFWLGVIAYFSIIATGNVQHDYYQSLIIPAISITIAVGIEELKKISKGYLLPATMFLLMIFMSWQQVKGYFNVNHWEYVEAGMSVDQRIPKDAKVIAPAFGDTAFLFQTNRTGWPIGFEIDQKIEQGATHYVSTAYDDEARMLEEKYQIIVKNDRYILINLTQPTSP